MANIREFILEPPGSIMDIFVIRIINAAPYLDCICHCLIYYYIWQSCSTRFFFPCLVPESIACTVWKPNSNGCLINNLATLTLAIQPNIVNKTFATSAISSPTTLCWCSCYSCVFNTSHSSPCTFQNWRLRQNAFLPELWMSPNMLYLMEEFTFIFSPLKSKYQIIFTIFAWYILFSLQLVFLQQ